MASLFSQGNNVYFRFRGNSREAAQLECINGNWIVFMRDLDDPSSYVNVGEYSSREEACTELGNNPALMVSLNKWTKRQRQYGFLAMQYGDDILENLALNHMKPVVASFGFHLQDMRDISQSGVIDMLMRDALRKSHFVIADLTHGNSGAYWEAGFAEALHKPVIYTCEKLKFDEFKTHFDTNHCTTILWSSNDTQRFENDLTAALKRSLGME